MIPEIGFLSLILALCTSVVLAVLPIWGSFRKNSQAMASAAPLSLGFFLFSTIAMACLAEAFLTDDFSVAIVAAGSNSLLPSVYKFAAIWGGHEGSMLLWIWILALWTVAVAWFSSELPLDVLARVLSVMGMIAVGFLLFSILTSNPFDRLLPVPPLDGKDLNPLLQDPGLIIHPPMLYVGYVGFSVVFSFAIAALIGGRLDVTWARWSRPWTNIAWGFLTAGIMLGSWWAYYELGWGGWWFWDPVENASFMPWLAGTALIHSLAVTEKRGLFKSWTVLLAIFTFSLSLLGTFLVRSGVLTSVHAFATDPSRGVFILIFLALVIGGSLTLYAFRAPTVNSSVRFSWISRELLLLVNNVIFVSATLTVLFGTLFPLVMDSLDQGKYSVGAPYFNAVFIPLMALLIPFMGIGPTARWKKDKAQRWKSELLVPALSALALGLIFPVLYGEQYYPAVAVAVIFASWLLFALIVDLRNKISNATSIYGGMRKLSPSYYGMFIAHMGFAVTLIGICLTSHYSVERDLKMSPGESYELSGLQFDFVNMREISGPNYRAQEAEFRVQESGSIYTLRPQKRHYQAQMGSVMTEAAISSGVFRHVYVALGEPLKHGAWAVRLYYKPFVSWIWMGAVLMAFGGLLTAADKRYRRRSIKKKILSDSVSTTVLTR